MVRDGTRIGIGREEVPVSSHRSGCQSSSTVVGSRYPSGRTDLRSVVVGLFWGKRNTEDGTRVLNGHERPGKPEKGRGVEEVTVYDTKRENGVFDEEDS